jgi:hypothetical protein
MPLLLAVALHNGLVSTFLVKLKILEFFVLQAAALELWIVCALQQKSSGATGKSGNSSIYKIKKGSS